MAHGRRTSLRLPSFGKRSNLKQNRAAPSAGKKSSFVKGMRMPAPAAMQRPASQAIATSCSGKAEFTEGLSFLKKPRSEEHTSELQSLMRTSYAVFCLNKKK